MMMTLKIGKGVKQINDLKYFYYPFINKFNIFYKLKVITFYLFTHNLKII